MKPLTIFTGLVLALLCGTPAHSHAAIFSSFGPGEFEYNSGAGAAYRTSVDDRGWAFQFNAGVGSGAFPDIEVSAALFAGLAINPSTIQLQLWSSEGVNEPVPGSLLGGAEFTLTETIAGNPDFLFTGTIPGVTLASDTDYFMAISYQSGGSADWYESNTHLGPVGYFDGVSWIGDDQVYELGAFSITPVPEPRGYAVVAGLALLGFGAYRRYRRSANDPKTKF